MIQELEKRMYPKIHTGSIQGGRSEAHSNQIQKLKTENMKCNKGKTINKIQGYPHKTIS